MKKNFGILFVLIFSVFCVQALTLFVVDKDIEIPLEGVQISLQTFSAYTDEEGRLEIELPQNFTKGIVTASLPGYTSKKISIDTTQKSIVIELSISEVIEGKELVVERSAPGKTDSKPAVSVVMTKKEMDTTANVGLVEDIMSSIKTLPGMGFSGGWNAFPSIRGGYPSEMGTVLDDIYVLQPFHWGGAFSIFNPNMVGSAKMSHGIFSARYGRAMSGLLEVTSKSTESKDLRVDAGISTNALDLFIQTPLGEKAGLFVGGKVTYLEPLGFFNDEILKSDEQLKDTINTLPYIRDIYAKLYFNPNSDLNITINGFLGSDGIGVKQKETIETIETDVAFDYHYLQGFVGLNMQWLASEKNRVHFVGSYNQNSIDIDMLQNTNGTRTYSEAFKDAYSKDLNDKNTYSLNNIGIEGKIAQTVHQIQAKAEYEWLMPKSTLFTLGSELVSQRIVADQDLSGWILVDTLEPPTYMDITVDRGTIKNKTINASLFALCNFELFDAKVQGELGIRGEHYYLWSENFELNTRPVFDPRLSISWKAFQNQSIFDSIIFSAGTGLFSMIPLDTLATSEDLQLENFKESPNRAWFQVIGTEMELNPTWLFKIEGFYKYYFNRLYITNHINTDTHAVDINVHTDGIGHTFGTDFMIQKKEGTYFDGYLSYSFVFSKFKNPNKHDLDTFITSSGEPVGTWYYPDFHRFHTLNLIANIKPTEGWVFTTKLSLASGKPKQQVDTIEMKLAELDKNEDLQKIEYYTRKQSYSDTLRDDLSLQLDLRIAYSNFYKNSKIRWEIYCGLENALVNVYKPKTNTGFDSFTGKEIPDSDSADFNIGIPMPSVGYKINY